MTLDFSKQEGEGWDSEKSKWLAENMAQIFNLLRRPEESKLTAKDCKYLCTESDRFLALRLVRLTSPKKYWMEILSYNLFMLSAWRLSTQDRSHLISIRIEISFLSVPKDWYVHNMFLTGEEHCEPNLKCSQTGESSRNIDSILFPGFLGSSVGHCW